MAIQEIEQKLIEQKDILSAEIVDEIEKEIWFFSSMLISETERTKLKLVLVNNQLTWNVDQDTEIIQKAMGLEDVDFSFENIFQRFWNNIKKWVFSITNFFYDITKNLYEKQKEIDTELDNYRQELENLENNINENNVSGWDGGWDLSNWSWNDSWNWNWTWNEDWTWNESENVSWNWNENNPSDWNESWSWNSNWSLDDWSWDNQNPEDIQNSNNTNQSDENFDNSATIWAVAVGVGVAGWSVALWEGVSYTMRNIQNAEIGRQIDGLWWQEKMIDNLVEQYEQRLERAGIDNETKDLIQKNINGLNQWRADLKALSETDALKYFDELQKKWIINISEFNKLNIEEGVADKIKEISWDSKKLKQLQTLLDASDDESKKSLKALLGNTQDLSDDALKVLRRSAQHADTLAQTGLLFKHAKLLKWAWCFLRRLPLLDMAFLGVDVWQFYGEDKEAQEIAKWNAQRWELMRDRAVSRLAVGLVWWWIEIAAAIIAWSAMWWPVGMLVWVGIWTTVQSIQYAMDSMYFDIKNFYEQNNADFLRQERTEIKQAIISASQSKNLDIEKLAINEKRFVNIDMNKKEEVLQRARESMIIQEEWRMRDSEKGEFAWSEDEKRELENRMKYINEVSKSDFYKNLFNQWNLTAVSELVSQSKFFDNMSQDESYEWDKNPNYENLENYDKKLESDLKLTNDSNYNYCENLYNEYLQNWSLEFWEMYRLAKNKFGNMDESQKELNGYKNAKFIVDFCLTKTWNLAPEDTPQIQENLNTRWISLFNDFVAQDSLEWDFATYINQDKKYTKEDLGTNFASGNTDFFDKYGLENISADPIENMLYEFAKWIHGYDGNNNMEELLWFFGQPEKESSFGLYFGGSLVQTDTRRINNDWAIDKEISMSELFEDMKSEKSTQEIIQWLMWKSNFDKMLDFVGDMPTNWSWSFVRNLLNSDGAGLDSKTETSDQSMNIRFWTKFGEIIERQRQFIKPENKAKYKTEIVDYIKNNWSDWYITLPLHLQVSAKKSGLWDCSGCFFTFENDKITVCTNHNNQDVVLDFVDNKEVIQRPFDLLSEPEKEIWDKQIGQYIWYVDKSAESLKSLLGRRWSDGHSDELDMPETYQVLFADKLKERENFKESLKDYEPEIAQQMISSKYESFQRQFENIYTYILDVIESNYISNDLDSAQWLSMILSSSQSDIVSYDSEKWFSLNTLQKKYNLFWTDFDSEDLSENVKKLYDLLDQKYPIGEDNAEISINELAKIDSKKAIWYVNILWKSILEAQIWLFDTNINDNMTQILLNNDYFIPEDNPEFENLSDKSFENLQIKELTEQEQSVSESWSSATADIENTAPEYVWQSERWDVKITLDPPEVKSYGLITTFKFDKEENLITIWDIEINIGNGNIENTKEVAFIGNFINFCIYNFKWKWNSDKPFNLSTLNNIQIDSTERSIDTVLLDAEEQKDKYSSLASNNLNKQKLIEYLNNLNIWKS